MRRASLAAAVAILTLAGCGGSSGAPTTTHDQIHLTPLEQHGKEVFVSTCGGCHTLADAGTSGTAGPALTTPLRAAFVLATIVHGKGAMQGNIVTGRDAAAVAAYVAAATK